MIRVQAQAKIRTKNGGKLQLERDHWMMIMTREIGREGSAKKVIYFINIQNDQEMKIINLRD